jgi:hypothetical protein
MDASAPLPSLASQKPTWDRAVALANEWGLNRLVERLIDTGDGAENIDFDPSTLP